MKSLNLVISDEAVSDLTEIWTHIAEDSSTRADQFIDQIHDKCLMLAQSPLIGRERSELAPNLRSFPMGRYLIFYRIQGEALQVVRILSGYRDIDVLF